MFEPASFCNRTSVYLSMLTRTAAGTLFTNDELKLAVIRWENLEDIEEMLSLAKSAVAYLQDADSDVLIWDLRRVQDDEASANDIACRMHVLKQRQVRRWAALSAKSSEDKGPWSQVCVSALAAGETQAAWTTDFHHATALLDSMASDRTTAQLVSPQMPEYRADYGGAVYYLPSVNAVVMRLSGNFHDLQMGAYHYQIGYDLARKMQASALIMDSSATPPLECADRRAFVFKQVFFPMTELESLAQMVHVRSMDRLISKNLPPLRSFMDSVEIAYFEAGSIEEAERLLLAMKGKTNFPAKEGAAVPTLVRQPV